MGILAVFIVLFSIMLQVDLHEKLALLSLPIHRACVEWAPASDFRHLYRALVCGSNLSEDGFSKSLRLTGLLHVVIVSGSHLLFLESVLQRLIQWRPKGVRASLIIGPLLVLYALATRFEPPVARALIGLALKSFNTRYKLFWTPVQSTAWAGLLTLGLFPEWLSSRSLLLSWGASLALASGRHQASDLFLNIRIYLVLFPLLLSFAAPHPVSILFNTLLAPILGTILFPACLLAFFAPPLTRLIDPAWEILVKLLTLTSTHLTSGQSVSVPLVLQWIFLGGLHFIFQKEVMNARKVPR